MLLQGPVVPKTQSLLQSGEILWSQTSPGTLKAAAPSDEEDPSTKQETQVN